MMINNPFAFTGGCQFRYDVVPARFYLYDDSRGWLGPLTAGSASTANNGRYILTGIGTSVSAGATSLSVTLNVTFQGTFTGLEKTFLYAQEGS